MFEPRSTDIPRSSGVDVYFTTASYQSSGGGIIEEDIARETISNNFSEVLDKRHEQQLPVVNEQLSIS